jgi:hypothetical protein
MKNIFVFSLPVFCFLICSCSSIRSSKPVYEKGIQRAISPSDITASADIQAWIRNAKSGSLVILLQNKRGKDNFIPEVDSVLIEGLKNKAIFTSVEVRPIDSVNIWNVDEEVADCRKNNKAYVLVVSYYDNNAVTLNVFHSAFKTITFNLYDLFPVFSYGIGPFNHYYTASLEATLIDVKSNFYVFNSNSAVFRERFSKGTSRTRLAETVYANEIFRLAAKELYSNILSKLSNKN